MTRRHCRESATGLGPQAPQNPCKWHAGSRQSGAVGRGPLKGRFFKNKSLAPRDLSSPLKGSCRQRGAEGRTFIWGARALGAGINRGIA